MKFVPPTTGPGPAVPQLKFTTASVRVRVGAALKVMLVKAAPVVFVQYWPSRPTPFPAAEVLTNDAPPTGLFTAPGAVATACTRALLVRRNGPV